MRKPEPKKPLDRMLLRSFKDEKHYIRKLESMMIDQGKRILDSRRVKYRIVTDKNIQQFINRHKDFYGTRWHQIGIERLYEDRVIDTFEYDFLITMKQILNKNGSYLLRHDEFDARNQIMKCKRYENKKVPCVQDECKMKFDCPLYKPETVNCFRNKNVSERIDINKSLKNKELHKKSEKLMHINQEGWNKTKDEPFTI